MAASALENKGVVLERLGKKDEAEEYYKRGIITLDNLALLYREKGDFDNAKQYYGKSLEVRRMLYGKNHPEFANGLFKLAEVYRLTWDYSDAESLYEDALKIYRTYHKETSLQKIST